MSDDAPSRSEEEGTYTHRFIDYSTVSQVTTQPLGLEASTTEPPKEPLDLPPGVDRLSDLGDADLSGADLTGANLNDATMPDGSIHD